MRVKICGVYGIFDSKTSECLYIGQSRDIHSRLKSHLKCLRNGTHKRKDFVDWFAGRDSDQESLTFTILGECEESDVSLNHLEIKWFEACAPKFYGSVPSEKNTWAHSVETRQKISSSVSKTLENLRDEGSVRLIDREIFCHGCGTSFSSQRKNQVYCDMDCFNSYKKGTTSKIEQAVCLSYLDGMSLRECRDVYGVSHVTVRKILISNNIDRRGH